MTAASRHGQLAITEIDLTTKCLSPPVVIGGLRCLRCVRRCPTFPPGLGSIIGAGRLSFRVRDGSGRFPAAMAAVTLVHLCGGGSVFGGGVQMLSAWSVVAGNVFYTVVFRCFGWLL